MGRVWTSLLLTKEPDGRKRDVGNVPNIEMRDFLEQRQKGSGKSIFGWDVVFSRDIEEVP
jgi:hypothetical protein